MMGDKLFCSDLYYRLPLRDRTEDIPLLVRHFVAKYAAKTGRQIDKISADTLRVLRVLRECAGDL
jgi:DNA-binding NtrC family response regulator